MVIAANGGCAAAHGTARREIFVPPSAAGSFPGVAIISMGFAWPGRFPPELPGNWINRTRMGHYTLGASGHEHERPPGVVSQQPAGSHLAAVPFFIALGKGARYALVLTLTA